MKRLINLMLVCMTSVSYTHLCKTYEFEVGLINIYANNLKTDVYYYPKGDIMSSESFKEDNCYPSKEELIKAL